MEESRIETDAVGDEEPLRLWSDGLGLKSTHLGGPQILVECAHNRPFLSYLVITRLNVMALSGIVQSLRIICIYMGHPSRSTASMPLASPRRRSNDIVHTEE